jgi:hypothetical protein
MWGGWLVGAIFVFSMGCSSDPREVHASQASLMDGESRGRNCIDIRIQVTGTNESSIGVPIKILIRNAAGQVTETGTTDNEGYCAIRVCWRGGEPPETVEARLEFGGAFLLSSGIPFQPGLNRYCIYLQLPATDCMNFEGFPAQK